MKLAKTFGVTFHFLEREDLSKAEQTRCLIGAAHDPGTEVERLYRLVAGLANLLHRDDVIETVRSFLGVDPVDEGDCVVFDDIAIRFGTDNRIKSVYRTIDGSSHYDL